MVFSFCVVSCHLLKPISRAIGGGWLHDVSERDIGRKADRLACVLHSFDNMAQTHFSKEEPSQRSISRALCGGGHAMVP